MRSLIIIAALLAIALPSAAFATDFAAFNGVCGQRANLGGHQRFNFNAHEFNFQRQQQINAIRLQQEINRQRQIARIREQQRINAILAQQARNQRFRNNQRFGFNGRQRGVSFLGNGGVNGVLQTVGQTAVNLAFIDAIFD